MSPNERGQRAKQLLEDEVLQDTFAAVRESIVAQIERSAFGDAETHHQASIALQILKQLKSTLVKFVDEGEAALLVQRKDTAQRNMRQSIRKP